MKRLILAAVLMLGGAAVAGAQPRLPELFSDRMVLQRQRTVPLWGTSRAGAEVTVVPSWSGKVYRTTADSCGRWRVAIATGRAGGPHRIAVSDATGSVELRDVLLGEVWLCSGQSNMEMPVEGWGKVLDYEAEVAAADHPSIRLLQLRKTMALAPQEEVLSTRGGWQVASPDEVRDFSAVAYFFARELNRRLRVPVGVIDASWGGTIVEAWTGAETLAEVPAFADELELLRLAVENLPAAREAYERSVARWSAATAACDAGMADGRPLWTGVGFDDSDWLPMEVPGTVADFDNVAFDGVAWLRRGFDLPADAAGREMTLELGRIDDDDITYVNGTEVGRTSGYDRPRRYTVPAGLLREGRNVVTVRVNDTGGDCGILGDAAQVRLTDGERTWPLAGAWRQRKGVAQYELPLHPAPFENNANFPTLIYNGMIRPIEGFGMRGAIWYQGESNEARAWQYRDIFPLLIRDWRARWGETFPFYFVQLANWRARNGRPVESNWAELREAQSMALRLERTGMAVAIDIGEAADIHPKNKQEVARRLALLALHDTYGKGRPATGPRYASMRLAGDSVELLFDNPDGRLAARGGVLRGFTVAGPDHVFREAEARIRDGRVIVRSDEVRHPVAVRYGWADNPEATLTDGAGLPASPFRTDDWPGITFRRE